MSQEFESCVGGGVAGEAIAVGLQYSGLLPSKTLLRSGETLSEAERARALAASRDVIHPFPAFNRVLGASLAELAAKVA